MPMRLSFLKDNTFPPSYSPVTPDPAFQARLKPLTIAKMPQNVRERPTERLFAVFALICESLISAHCRPPSKIFLGTSGEKAGLRAHEPALALAVPAFPADFASERTRIALVGRMGGRSGWWATAQAPAAWRASSCGLEPVRHSENWARWGRIDLPSARGGIVLWCGGPRGRQDFGAVGDLAPYGGNPRRGVYTNPMAGGNICG